ncbi:MAG TPA: HD domain-containing phosphohydrolase [Candidatus Goldiibacteriota bacterium]|nr:HD domain-containing phosphohydrolase [Candidatus Goldiibacteriota bacterium]
MRIKAQFITGIVTIILVSVAAITFVLARDAESILMQSVENRAGLVINYLSGVVVDPMLKKDELQLNYFIKKVSDTPGLSFIIISDNSGNIIGASSVSDIGKNIKKDFPELASLPESGSDTAELDYRGRRIRAKVFYSPIEVKSGTQSAAAGRIDAGFDLSVIESAVYGVYIKSGVIAAIVIIFSIIITFLFANTITRPLEKLIEGTETVAAGNLRHKIKLNVNNEFRSLANSFNSMTEKLNDYYDGVLNAFAFALDSKDKYTPGHSKRVAMFAMELAKSAGMGARQVENLRIAALLKDVGNISVDSNIFVKKEALTPDDIIKIQKHPEISARILKNIPQLKDVVPIILQHHERYDGLGYPAGLKGDEILKEAKILAIADAYDAMITPREHRAALSKEECIYELRENKGKQFDPLLTEKFIELILIKEGVDVQR